MRAKSEGVAGDKLRAAVAYAGYALPVTVQPDENTWQTAPIRLALLDTRDAGRIACRSVYVGKDPETGRYGNFFTHMLLDVPEDVGAGRVIQSWESAGWQGRDDDGPAELAELDQMPRDGTLDSDSLATLLQDARRCELMQFLLSAYLSLDKEQRIFLVAPSTDVAICIYGLLTLLNVAEQHELTFSTYESEPLSCSARIVGTWYGESSDVELSSSCYHGSNVGFNICTGKQTDLSHATGFVDFVIAELRDGSTRGIEKYRKLCGQYGASDLAALDVVYRIQTSKDASSTSKKEVSVICRHPQLATKIATGYPGFLSQCVRWAEDDEKMFDRTVNALVNGEAMKVAADREAGEYGNANVNAWLLAIEYLRNPSVSHEQVHRLADAIGLHPSSVLKRVRDECLTEASVALYVAAGNGDVQEELENVVASFAPLYGDSCALVYRMLLAEYLKNAKALSYRPRLLTAIVAVGIGRASSPTVKKSVGQELIPDVRRMAHALRRKKLKKGLNLVTCDAVVKKWSKKHVRLWKSLKRTRGDKVKTVLLTVAVVSVVAGLVFVGLCWMDIFSLDGFRDYFE